MASTALSGVSITPKNFTFDGIITLLSGSSLVNSGSATFTGSTANTPVILATGNGTGPAVQFTSANVATATALKLVATGTTQTSEMLTVDASGSRGPAVNITCNVGAVNGVQISGDSGSNSLRITGNPTTSTLSLATTTPKIDFQPGAAGNKITLSSAITPATASRTVSFYDPTADCDLLVGVKRVITENTLGPTALTAAQSGAIIKIDSSTTAVGLTLPAVITSAGINYHIVWAVAGNDSTITTAASETKITGHAINAALVAAETGKHTITFVSANATVGDYVDLVCDGLTWQMLSNVQVAAGMTYT